MLGGITSSELFKQSKIWIQTAVQSVKNLVAKFTGTNLSEKELKDMHAKPKTEKVEKLDRSKLSEDEIKVLDLKLGEMNTLCKKVLPRSGDVGVFFTSPDNPKDPLAKLMDKTVFNLMRTVTADKSKNDEELMEYLGEELAKVIPVHVGAIVNNNGKYIVIQSDLRGIKNKLRIENLEDLTYRSSKYGSIMSLYQAGYTTAPNALVEKYKKTSDQYNYSVSTVLGRGVNVITNGLLNQVLENIETNQENLVEKIKDSKTVENLQARLSKIKTNLEKVKLANNNKSEKKSNVKTKKEQKTIFDTICVDFILKDILEKIVPTQTSRSLLNLVKQRNGISQMTPISMEKAYQKDSNISPEDNHVKFGEFAIA
ncbi:MAG: hypothetical protein HRT47_05160 [Candidatus Caenarcaniphilales bacterium]|nr:hypothetical protein [Candidatus Caenarcaniphilales bacterium]